MILLGASMFFQKNLISRAICAILAVAFILCAFPAFSGFAADCTAGLTPGDANGDGKVNVKDVMTILKSIASWDVEMNADNADVRRDSKVNVRDAMLILKVSAGWTDVRLGHNDETVCEEASCTADGGTLLRCTLCKSEHYLERTEKTGHDFSEGVCSFCDAQIPGYESMMADINAAKEGFGDRAAVGDSEYLRALDARADEMKQKVLSTESEYTVGEGGKIYYFSAEGDDTNDGLSEETPKKNISALSSIVFNPGDVVLFRRGDTFAGTVSARSGVTYSAYGEGDKPVISGAMRDFASSKAWRETNTENVWKLSTDVPNVGIVMFNRSWEIGNYNEITGVKKMRDKDDFYDERDLQNDFEFYSDLDTNELYIYCSGGNPGDVYDSILVGKEGAIFYVGTENDVTIDNLHITLGGSHGVGGGDCSGLTVRNCVLDYIGGSVLRGFGGANITRYGNAVEIYGSAKDFTVYNNWIYQIYDTGITHQYSTNVNDPENIHDGVEYYDNLIEYCFWSIEYYNYYLEGGVRETKNVSIHDNFCRFGGEGWGCVGRETNAMLTDLNFTKEYCENFVIKNNVYDRCRGMLLRYTNPSVVEFSDNTFIQYYNEHFAQLFKVNYPLDQNAVKVLNDIGDTTSKVVYVTVPRELDVIR